MISGYCLEGIALVCDGVWSEVGVGYFCMCTIQCSVCIWGGRRYRIG